MCPSEWRPDLNLSRLLPTAQTGNVLATLSTSAIIAVLGLESGEGTGG